MKKLTGKPYKRNLQLAVVKLIEDYHNERLISVRGMDPDGINALKCALRGKVAHNNGNQCQR